MAITLNKQPTYGVNNKVNTAFSQINSSDYTTSRIQDNITNLEATLSSKINALSNNYCLAYSESSITISSTGPIIFPKSSNSNIYSTANGRMTVVFNGFNTFSGLINISSGTLGIELYKNGVSCGVIADGTGPITFCIANNLTQGDTLWLQVVSGSGTISGYSGGLGCQICLRW